MAYRSTSQRLADAVRNAQRKWRRELAESARQMPPPQPPPPPFTIAISREAGTGAVAVAQELAQRLGWIAYDRELVEHIASRANLRVELMERVDERRPHWLEEFLASLQRGAAPAGGKYIVHLIETLSSLGAHGDCIIVGRGAGMLLPKETTLSVRLVAALPDRIAAAQAERELSKSDAKSWVEQTDRERNEFVQRYFRRDPTEPHLYDLTLNLSRLTHDACVNLIAAALEYRRAGSAKPAST